MPPGLQANNLSPMGFGQPNMSRAANAAGGPGYGMIARPVAPGQEPVPQAPPGGAGKPKKKAPKGPSAMGVPPVYLSPMGQEAKNASPPKPLKTFPGQAQYNHIQHAILDPGPPRPPMMAPPQPGPPPMMAGPPMGLPPMGPPPMGPPPMGFPPDPMMAGMAPPPLPPMGPMPSTEMMPGPMGAPGGNDPASAIAWMQQQLGGNV